MRRHITPFSRCDRRQLFGVAGAAGAAMIIANRPVIAQDASDATPPANGRDIIDTPDPVYPGGPISGGTIRVGVATPDLGDPAVFSPVAGQQDPGILGNTHESLVRPDRVTMAPVPWLAESWSWDESQTVVTYQLRRDVVWHDGTPFTAEDARFSLFAHRDDPESAARNFFVLMDDAEAVNEATLRVTLLAPDYAWILNASTQPIFQREQYLAFWQERRVGERSLNGFDWADNLPLGTGPWQFAGRDDDQITLDRFDAYWGSLAHADQLVFQGIPGSDARIEAWQSGDLDILAPVTKDEAAELADDTGRLYRVDTGSVAFAAFNFAHSERPVGGLFGDERVRQALSLAIDRERYANFVYGGAIHEDRAVTIAQPWAYDPAITSPAQDREAASALLAEAGWEDRDGDGIRESLAGQLLNPVVIVQDAAPAELTATLEFIAEDLAGVGVVLTIEALRPDAFATRWIQLRNWDLMALSYGVFPGFTDYDLYGTAWDIRTNAQGFNPGGYANGIVDLAITTLFEADADDLDVQRAILNDLQLALTDDPFALWLGHPRTLVAIRPEVLGYQPNIISPTLDMHLLWRTDNDE